MIYRLAGVAVLICFLIGCSGGKPVVRANGKNAEEWSKQVETGKSDARINALTLISQICEHDPSQVKYLTVGLKHDDSATRMTAIKFLKNLGPKAILAAPELQAIVANEAEEPLLKKEAEEALAAILPAGSQAPPATAVPATTPAPPATPAPAAAK